MNLFSFSALVLSFFFGSNVFSQNTLKEQLKLLEQNSKTAKFDSIVLFNKDIKNTNIYNNIGLNLCKTLDTLIVFVTKQKHNNETTFDSKIKPFLENQIVELNIQTLNFTDDEDLVYESFTNALNYDNALIRVKVYEDFIVKNFNDPTQMENILIVFSYIKSMCFYLLKEPESPLFKHTTTCFIADLKSYNKVNWNIFALNPGAMLLWTMAACAWDYKPEK